MSAAYGGARYHALDPDTYFWAHATFLDQVFYFADTFVKRLTDAEKQRMYAESKTWYRRYGVSDRPMPDTYADFATYWQHMLDDVVIAHPSATYSVGYVAKGFPRPRAVPPLLWKVIAPVFDLVAAFLTTGGLPPRARAVLNLQWTATQGNGATSASRRSGAPGRSTGSGTGCRWRCATTVTPEPAMRVRG